MATCTSPYFIPMDSRKLMGVPALGGRVRPLKIVDEKNGLLSIGQKSGSSSIQFKCSANSHSVNQFHSRDPFLNLHPEISMLRGETSTTMTNPRQDSSSENVTESPADSHSLNNYNKAKIKVIGVGGGGSNAINRMIESAMTGIEFCIVNTDIQAIKMSLVLPDHRLQIGQELTRGLGAGGKPDIGMNAAKETKEAIEKVVPGADMVFVTAQAPMAISVAQSPTWEEIDRAESYLVCCMFDKSASLSSSILSRLLENCDYKKKGNQFPEKYENERDDMLESAGMVLVQSMKQLQRTSEIFKELELLFGSVAVIPVQVFLAGVCFHMSEGHLTVAQGFLEEFLNNWKYVDQRYYLLSSTEANASDIEGSWYRISIGVDEYLEAVELYVMSLLAMAIKDTDLAISWVDKAMLPEERRQELLRRLHSLSSSKVNSSSQASMSPQQTDEYKTNSDPFGEQKQYNGHLKDFESGHLAGGGNTTKQEILKLSRHRVPYFWWFPSINLKFGNYRLVVPSGKVLLSCLLLLMYYFMRRKQAALKRVLAKKSVSIKKALVDWWQLAFSYQVNPLAAVQPLPTATRGSY